MRKKVRKKTLSPISLFFILIVGTILLSFVVSLLGKIEINNKYPFAWLSQGSYSSVNSVTGELETHVIEVESLLNKEGFQYIISNVVSNFVTFAPLGMLLISLIGLSVAEKSGLIKSISSLSNGRMPNFVLTMIIIFLGIISSLFLDIGYVILIPLAALLFTIKKRNPLGGIISAFAGIAGGYGISIFAGSLDSSLSLYTASSAKLLDLNYNVSLYGNLFYIIIATIIITIVGTIITEKMIMTKLPMKRDNVDELVILEKKEKRGLIYALISVIVISLIFVYMIIPGLPFSGILLDSSANGYVNQLLGVNSYFQQGLIVMIAAIFFISGLFYGLGSKTIKDDKDIIDFITSSKNNLGYLIILIFFASQFIAIFKKTNIGTVLTITFIDILKNLNITGLPLIMLFFILIMLSTIFLTSPTIKWSIIAPVMVPMFMQSNISPEFTQAIFRSATSVTNIMTPLLAYYVIYLGYLQIYNDNEVITFSKSFKYMLPYSLLFGLTFLLLIIIWYIIGLPIGPGVYPTL